MVGSGTVTGPWGGGCRSAARVSVAGSDRDADVAPRETAALDPFDFVRTIAVARILMPRAHVRLSAGRSDMSDEMQALCFLAGANSIFYGEKLLTTGNPDTAHDQRLFERLKIVAEAPREGLAVPAASEASAAAALRGASPAPVAGKTPGVSALRGALSEPAVSEASDTSTLRGSASVPAAGEALAASTLPGASPAPVAGKTPAASALRGAPAPGSALASPRGASAEDLPGSMRTATA